MVFDGVTQHREWGQREGKVDFALHGSISESRVIAIISYSSVLVPTFYVFLTARRSSSPPRQQIVQKQVTLPSV